ncbi:uncharacterized protein LOC108676220 [Hyalella azteca]|uniref:Uncharacterized protein LOC108676220 n=1 Tax=Hyalella azteca TaxID=294128 RepID=A0A8B7P173_HYAAZ|nr:uncharacterized protein LOC108676220 [Hyalella azteca]
MSNPEPIPRTLPSTHLTRHSHSRGDVSASRCHASPSRSLPNTPRPEVPLSAVVLTTPLTAFPASPCSEVISSPRAGHNLSPRVGFPVSFLSGASSSPRTSVPSSPRIPNHSERTTNASSRGAVTVSSLYSTAQCILSMVGSIGVILLFAGIPQLIYSPSVQLNNLMTFLLGASLITAMVAGNAFVNYKYRQYLHRNPVTRPARRTSLEGREDKPPPYEDIEKMDAQPPDYPSAVAVASESPPSYHWLARMYQWGNLIDTTTPGSVSNQPGTSCDSGDSETSGPNVVIVNSGTCGNELCGKNTPNRGQVNNSFEINAYEPCGIHSRKISSTSIPSTPSKLQHAKGKSKRSKSSVPNTEEVFSDDSKTSGLWNIRKAFLRSVSDDGFLSLPNNTSTDANSSSGVTPRNPEMHIGKDDLQNPERDGDRTAAGVSSSADVIAGTRETFGTSGLASNSDGSNPGVEPRQSLNVQRFRRSGFIAVNVDPSGPVSLCNLNSRDSSGSPSIFASLSLHGNGSSNSEFSPTLQKTSKENHSSRRMSEDGETSLSKSKGGAVGLGRRASSSEVHSISSRLKDAQCSIADEYGMEYKQNVFM